jgi:hypothetical protein
MKPSREPYGKSARVFTDGFTLTFASSGNEPVEVRPNTLRFEPDWFSHFAPNSAERPLRLYSARSPQR